MLVISEHFEEQDPGFAVGHVLTVIIVVIFIF